MGLGAKNSKQKPRFAVRFSCREDIEAFTKEKELPSFVPTSRCKLEGISPTIGSAGALQFLESKGWTVDEILHFGDRHVVFTATKVGSTELMFYHHGVAPQQLRWKALNSLAQKEQADSAKAARGAASNAAAREIRKRNCTEPISSRARKIS